MLSKEQLLAQLESYKTKAAELKQLAEEQVSGRMAEVQRLRGELETQLSEAKAALESLADSGIAIGKDTVEDAKGVAERYLGEAGAKLEELKSKIGA